MDVQVYRVLRVVIVILVVFAGCDSVVERSEFRQPRAVVAVESSIDLVVEPGQPTTLDVSKYFKHTLGLPLSYSIAFSGTTANATITGSEVEIVPIREGSSSIEVYASDINRNSATSTIVVEVLESPHMGSYRSCPPPSVSLANYFPINLGSTISYDYRFSELRNGDHTETIGTLFWDFISFDRCENGEQTVSINERFEGLRTFRSINVDSPDTSEVTWSRSIVASIGETIFIPGYINSPTPRYSSEPADSQRAFNDSGDKIILKKDTGLIYRYAMQNYGTGWDESLVINRRVE